MCKTANPAAVSDREAVTDRVTAIDRHDPLRCVQDAQGGTLHATPFLGWLPIRVPKRLDSHARNVARISVRNCTHILLRAPPFCFLPFALSAILRINHQASCVDPCRTRVCNRPSICRAVSAPCWDPNFRTRRRISAAPDSLGFTDSNSSASFRQVTRPSAGQGSSLAFLAVRCPRIRLRDSPGVIAMLPNLYAPRAARWLDRNRRAASQSPASSAADERKGASLLWIWSAAISEVRARGFRKPSRPHTNMGLRSVAPDAGYLKSALRESTFRASRGT